METLKKLKWGKVAALTQDGQKYSDYISEMQVNNLFFRKLKIFTEDERRVKESNIKSSLPFVGPTCSHLTAAR
jgi:hypothetical protein